MASQRRRSVRPVRIRIIDPFTAGSASDLLARMIGPRLSDAWGQQVVVDNRPSARGTVAGSIVATATPDGHTLMLISSAFAGSAALYDKLPYDSVRDFSGVSLVATTALVLIVSPTLGAKTVPMLPDVPTIAEAALPGFEYVGWFGVLAPSRTPRPIIDKLSAEIGRVIAIPDVQERISRDGSTPKSSSPQAFDRIIREEIVTRRKVFKAAGVKPE